MNFAHVFFLLTLFAAPNAFASADRDCAKKKIDEIELSSPLPGRTAKRSLSLAGIACADACLTADPGDGACYYYRGVNRGHLLETMLANPKTHIPQMVEDFKKADSLSAAVDGAGPARALGYIFLQLPGISLWGGEYKRDIGKAASYSERALKLAPDEPDNLKLAGEIAAARDDFKTATTYFEKSLDAFKKKPAAVRGDIVAETEKSLQKSRGKSEP